MARTPLASRVLEIALSRRQFLGAAGAVAASVAAWTPRARAATGDRIVIVGAGLAGLTCAYRLKQAGVSAELHEASDRLGGRCWSIRGAFGPGLVAEHGGELIDTGHIDVRQLAKELGLVTDNIEFGAECDQQSALNLLYLLGYVGQGRLRLFGKSNEKLHIRGGNDQLVQAMAAPLRPQITTGSQLVAIAQTAAGRYTLTFKQGRTTRTMTADRVVLALPFSLLRTVDYAKAGFGLEKTRAIRELPMGTNSKLNVGFKTRHWRSLGCNGDTYADTGYQATWEVSRAQPGSAGILVDYTGGRIGDSFGSGTPVQRAQRFIGQIEPLLPGLGKQFDGNATVDYWAAYPWTLGSYSYYRPGQYTRFGGAEPEAGGACHFAGEHTTQDFQGYLNGAVFSGNRAAKEVLGAL